MNIWYNADDDKLFIAHFIEVDVNISVIPTLYWCWNWCWINDGSTNFVIGRYVGQSSANTNSYLFDNFNFFLRPQDKLLFSMSSLATFVTAINFSITPIADVNGNLINPSGYDPQ